MRIVLIIASLGSGGAERVLSTLANYWVSKGHQLSLITFMSHQMRPFYHLDEKINLIQLDQISIGSSLITRLWNVIRRILWLRKTIHHLKPDIVVSFIDVTNITTLLAIKNYNIPVIISERIDPNFHVIPRLYTWLRFRIYPFCTKLIVQTESAAGYFPEKFRSFLRIIPNPVLSPRYFKEKFSEKVQNIITVGRLDPQKDHITLLYAFSKIVSYFPALKLIIYGEGEGREHLENMVISLGLKDKVFLPGNVTNIEEIFIQADLFVFPSRYEGFPNALCEAMAVGLPVVASNCSGNVDVIRDRMNGRLFSVGDVQELTNIILELLGDHQQRTWLAKNARDICNHFPPQRIYDLWDEIISQA